MQQIKSTSHLFDYFWNHYPHSFFSLPSLLFTSCLFVPFPSVYFSFFYYAILFSILFFTRLFPFTMQGMTSMSSAVQDDQMNDISDFFSFSNLSFLFTELPTEYSHFHKNRNVHFLSVKFSIWNLVFGLDLNPCTLVCNKIESRWHALNGFANTQSAPASRNMLTSSLSALPVRPNINLSNPHFLIAVVASPPFYNEN